MKKTNLKKARAYVYFQKNWVVHYLLPRLKEKLESFKLKSGSLTY